jgi:signal transduction histidine kinase
VRQTWSAAEIDSLAASFNAALARVDEAVAREQRFVADAAHELRTPLTRLSAQLELAREEAREGKAVEVRLGAAIRSTRELVDLTEALLAMAQGETGRTEAVDLGDVIGACVSRLEPSEAARVRVRRAEGDVIARGIEPLLALAVANLIDNALKYAPGEIEVTLGVERGAVCVEVDDEGPGIPAAELETIREPFVRGSMAGERRGTGIGLALVEHVARLHDGALDLANRRPSGLHAGLRVRAWAPVAE